MLQKYPDRVLMYTIGSGFYALMFVVSFPAFSRIDANPLQVYSVLDVVVHSFACGMMVRTELF